MKKIIFASLLIVLISSGVAFARNVELPWTNNIYMVSGAEEQSNGITWHTVSVFDDEGNKCYVLNSKHDGPQSISCVGK